MEKLVCYILTILLVSISSVYAQNQSGSDEEGKNQTPPPPVNVTPPSHEPIPNQLDLLLDRIEKAGGKLKSFEAQMLFQQEQTLVETLTVRRGKLYYQVGEKTVHARIHFMDYLQQDLEDPTAPQRITFDEDYAFDGMWVTRRNERTKRIERWQVAKSPRSKEAFRLGKGPFPLPFAVKKKDVTDHFQVALVKRDPNDPRDTDHLSLIPKNKSPYAQEYLKMDLWFSKKTALPVRISYEKDDYEITTVTWTDPQIDKKIKNKVFQLKPAGRGWTQEIHPLEEPPKEDL